MIRPTGHPRLEKTQLAVRSVSAAGRRWMPGRLHPSEFFDPPHEQYASLPRKFKNKKLVLRF